MLKTMHPSDMLRQEPIRRLKVVDYLTLAEGGAFDGERVELLHGVVLTIAPIGPDHTWITSRIAKRLYALVEEPDVVIVQASIELTDESMPEPDIALLHRPNKRAYPTSPVLLVEVSDSSLRRDRLIKSALYAAAGVPEYWIVDVAAEMIEVYTEPRDGTYRMITRLGAGDTLRSSTRPSIELSIDDIFAATRD